MEHTIRQQATALKICQARLDSVACPSVPLHNVRNRSRSPRGLALAAVMRVPPPMIRANLAVGGAPTSLEDFATQNNLDAKCYEVLQAAPLEVQQMVISQGPAEGKNPSAMVVARIAKCGAGFTKGCVNAAMGGASGIVQSPENLEEFICMNELDDKCAQALRNQSWPCQAAVMAKGTVEGRNPSAMIMGRVAKFMRSNGSLS
eukprot:NODE_14619_length_1097_cov_4.788660.p1 GENE.NODE_14619_length_1097_cov_4.788660~~NODE_14619_length_1097_cov_4.788660.p1  ORF type:complete len:238 (+),score=46.76 NODE_14619_length_1097_cov_4.788660:107-715(+)